jgi:hypothetical protein
MVARGVDRATGRPLVIRIDGGYADVTNRQRFPFRIVATIHFTAPRLDGFPSEAEQPALQAAEAQLVTMLAREAVPIAVVTANGRRDLLFQSRVVTAFADDGVTPTRIGACDVVFTIESDKEWSEYDRLLGLVRHHAATPVHPTVDAVELVEDAPGADAATADREVLAQLARRGVDLEQPRLVRHYVYVFSDDAQRAAAGAIAAGGWDIEQRQPLASDPERRVVVASRPDVVLDDETVAAMRSFFVHVARRAGGEYDGWEAAT